MNERRISSRSNKGAKHPSTDSSDDECDEPRRALQVLQLDGVSKLLECPGLQSETNLDSGAADAMEQSKLVAPACGTSSEAAELTNSQLPSAAAERGDDTANAGIECLGPGSQPTIARIANSNSIARLLSCTSPCFMRPVG